MNREQAERFAQAELGERRNRACELMRFGPDGKITAGEALYGIDL